MKAENPLLVLLAFIAIYVIWGSTYLAIAYAIDTIPPFLMAGTRFIITAFILFLWMKIKNIPNPTIAQFKAASISGILMFVGGNVSVVWAEKYISTGVAAIIIASMPIWFVLLDVDQLKNLGKNYLLTIGLILGFFGVMVLVGFDTLFLINSSTPVLISYGLLILATITWAIGTLYTRKANHPINVASKIMVQLIASGIVTILLSLLSNEMGSFKIESVSSTSIFALGYLIVFGTLIAYFSYVWLIQIRPAAQVGTYTYVNPVIAVILGWIFRDEIISPNLITGLIIILVSIFLINYSYLKKRKVIVVK